MVHISHYIIFIFTGGFTTNKFMDTISEIEQLLLEHPFVLLCDNARPHAPTNPPRLNDNHQLRYLPPYSPFINCAEMAGSVVKAAVKRSITNAEIRMEMDDRTAAANAGSTLQQHRLQVLQRELKRHIPEVLSVDKCGDSSIMF